MTENEIEAVLTAQRALFATGLTRAVAYRRAMLRRLEAALTEYESELAAALMADLGKSAFEGYLCETGMALSEVRWMLRHLSALAAEKRVATPLAQWPAASVVSREPYGTVLIMSPWNYPALLTLGPLIDALAAGNTAVVKPSAYAPATSALLQKILSACFAPELVFVVTGGRAENQALLHQKFDKIFFTGGKTVGREVLRCAAENLTPVTLELGGKSPCIVAADADVALAARRIVFGKFLNCGQTCIAPDYVYCDEKIYPHLLRALYREVSAQLGPKPLENPDYGKIITPRHFARLCGLIDAAGAEKLYLGGERDAAQNRIAPTILRDVTFDDAVMGEEIFGPVLPVLTYKTLDAALAKIESLPHPLALYFFSRSRAAQKKVLARCRFGGGCINDTIIHLATSEMPFGGVGESGMGHYHGRAGFEEFSHARGVVIKNTPIDPPMRYQPYSAEKLRLVRRFLR